MSSFKEFPYNFITQFSSSEGTENVTLQTGLLFKYCFLIAIIIHLIKRQKYKRKKHKIKFKSLKLKELLIS